MQTKIPGDSTRQVLYLRIQLYILRIIEDFQVLEVLYITRGHRILSVVFDRSMSGFPQMNLPRSKRSVYLELTQTAGWKQTGIQFLPVRLLIPDAQIKPGVLMRQQPSCGCLCVHLSRAPFSSWGYNQKEGAILGRTHIWDRHPGSRDQKRCTWLRLCIPHHLFQGYMVESQDGRPSQSLTCLKGGFWIITVGIQPSLHSSPIRKTHS